MHDSGAVVREFARDERACGHPREVGNLEAGEDARSRFGMNRGECRRHRFRNRLEQHLVGTEDGRTTLVDDRRFAQHGKRTGQRKPVHVDPEVTGEQLRIGKQILGIVRRRDQQLVGDRAGMDLGLGLRLHEIEHGAHGPGAHLDGQLPRLHFVDPRFPISTAEILIEHALVLEPSDGGGKRRVALRSQHEGHHDEPVGTWLDDRVSHARHDLSATIGGTLGAIVTREGRVAVDGGVTRSPQQGSDHGGLHGGVEVLAKAGSLALVDRRDRISRRLNGTVIGRLRKPDRQRRAITITLMVQEPACS